MATVPDQSSTGSSEDTDFGANDWLLEEMYEQYTADPSSVDESWASYFKTHGAPGAGDSGGAGTGRRGRPGRGPATARATASAAPAQPRRAAEAGSGPGPGVQARGLRGTGAGTHPSAREAAPRRVRRPRRRDADRGAADPDQREPAGDARAPAAAYRPIRRTRRNRPNVNVEEPVSDRPAGRPRPNRQEHGHLADGADRDQRPLAAGQAADRPARGDQQPSPPGPRRQGLLHPPDRLRHGAGAEDAPGDEQRLRRGRRQADHGGARRTSTSAWPSTCPSRTAPGSCWCRASRTARRWTSRSSGPRTSRWSRRPGPASSTVEDFAGTTITLTNPGTIGTNHSVPRLMQGQGAIIGVGSMDYPPEFQGSDPDKLSDDERLQGDDADLHLRPPGHPGRPVRSVPAAAARPAARRGRLLRRRLRARCGSRTSRSAGRRTSAPTTRTRSPSRPGSWR